MRLKIPKGLLEQVLSQLQPFLEKKDISQITSHTYLKTSQNSLTLKATDYETGLETVLSTGVEIEEEGEATANGKKLLEIVRILKEGEVTLKTEGDTLLIQQGRSRFKLPMFDPTQYPNFPQIQNLPTLNISTLEFINSLKKITPAIDSNNPKFELNGALIDITPQQINFVATDTRRLALVTLKENMEKEVSLIIPKKAIIEIQKLFFDKSSILYDQNYLIIKSGSYLFFTKLINGKFPNYSRIIPSELNYSLTLPKKEMIEAIKQVNIISNEIKLTFYPDKILFESLSEENIEAQTEMQASTPFKEPFVMGLNSKYLLDFLTHIEEDNFTMGINEADLPFEVKSNNFLTIIMPIIV
ncbi:MAG: DNA polymerase III subunit beta [Epsilonproteobacteria bacterium]|nr:DNA polymerase III subunit beta [Campylobacterota bacterium]